MRRRWRGGRCIGMRRRFCLRRRPAGQAFRVRWRLCFVLHAAFCEVLFAPLLRRLRRGWSGDRLHRYPYVPIRELQFTKQPCYTSPHDDKLSQSVPQLPAPDQQDHPRRQLKSTSTSNHTRSRQTRRPPQFNIPTFGNSKTIPHSAFRTQWLLLLLCQAHETLQNYVRKPNGEIIRPILVFSANPSRKKSENFAPIPTPF